MATNLMTKITVNPMNNFKYMYADCNEQLLDSVFNWIPNVNGSPVVFKNRLNAAIYAFENPGIICCASIQSGALVYEAVVRGDETTLFMGSSTKGVATTAIARKIGAKVQCFELPDWQNKNTVSIQTSIKEFYDEIVCS